MLHVIPGLMITLICLTPGIALSLSLDFIGELSASVTANDTKSDPVYAGMRYTPEIFIDYAINDSNHLGLRAAGDATTMIFFDSIDETETDSDADIYRLWLRFSASQWEARIGKQKLSFGAATLLRPLMWFDSIDPRDPLQKSDGVWGLLARYYFVNNVNVWAWGLYGNEDPKGWEAIPTDEDEVEYGGRIQVPVPFGEIGASYHHRTADASGVLPAAAASANGGGLIVNPSVREDRFGFDAKWDLGVGAWAEGAHYYQDNPHILEPYQNLLTLGMDYTFDIGEGLTALVEHFLAVSSDEAFGKGNQSSFSGVSLTYPWGLIDSFGMILYFDYDAEEFYRFLDWRRRYDRWTFHAMGFINPQTAAALPMQRESNLLQGGGMQVLIVFNH